MKRILSGTSLAAVIIALSTIISCAPPGGGQKTISIRSVWWVLENIDTGYWTDGFDSATCFGWFSIEYAGDIAISDIDYAEFHKVGDSWYWSFPIDSTTVDTNRRVIQSFLNHSNVIASNGSVFPIGQIEFELVLRNGSSSKYVLDVPAPGQLSSAGKNYVYTEDFLGTPGSDYVAMLKRPSCLSQSRSGAINVTFSCSDSKFFSGYIELYDSLNTVVGRSPYFRVYGTGAVASFINGGTTIWNNGSVNNVTLQQSDITFASGKSYSDVAKYSVKLSDGAQYLGTNFTYDCVSIGPKIAF